VSARFAKTRAIPALYTRSSLPFRVLSIAHLRGAERPRIPRGSGSLQALIRPNSEDSKEPGGDRPPPPKVLLL